VKRWVKRLGIGVLGLVLLVGLAGAGLYGVTSRSLSRTFDVQPAPVVVPTDAEAVARGERLVAAITKCTECHGANMQGQILVDDPAFARLVPANLTRGEGGVANNYKTDADWVRAIRHGVSPDGRALVFMPSNEYYHLSDADLGDLIAWLKALPPQNNVLPAQKYGPVLRGLYAAKKVPPLPAEAIDHTAPRPAAVAPGATAEYGKYLAEVGGCTGCHRPNLAGGKDPFGPPGKPWPANLTRAGRLGAWTEEDFKIALRTGKRPDGSNIDPFMPWSYTAKMTDDEIRAVWLYLQTVPAVGGIVETPSKS
jgi:mono/diheme cytochrome c family protein